MRCLNRYIVLTLAIVGIVMFSTGCKKDKNPDTGKPLLIASSIEVNSSNPKDTAQQYYFSYDNNNRLTKLVSKLSTYAALTYNFSYDANSNMTRYTMETQGVLQEIHAFTYNNGLPVKRVDSGISAINSPAVWTYYYSYSDNNNNLIINAKYNVADGNRVEGDTIIYKNNNQLYWGQGLADSTYQGTVTGINTSTYTFGSRRGPYSSINLKQFISSAFPIVNDNEILTSSGSLQTIDYYAHPVFLTDPNSYTYVYNSAGYAISATGIDQKTLSTYVTYFRYIPSH